MQHFQEKEDALRTFYDTTIRPKEELMYSLQEELDDLYQNGWSPLETLNQELEELHSKGEAQLHAQTGGLEQQIFALENEVQQLYPSMEEEMQIFQEEFQQLMWDLDDRRYSMRDMWQTLEEEMRQAMETLHISVEDERQKLQDQLAAINQLELELDEFYQQERALQLELRVTQQSFGPMQQQMESRLLDLLESALSTVADEDKVLTEPNLE